MFCAPGGYRGKRRRGRLCSARQDISVRRYSAPAQDRPAIYGVVHIDYNPPILPTKHHLLDNTPTPMIHSRYSAYVTVLSLVQPRSIRLNPLSLLFLITFIITLDSTNPPLVYILSILRPARHPRQPLFLFVRLAPYTHLFPGRHFISTPLPSWSIYPHHTTDRRPPSQSTSPSTSASSPA